VTHDTRGDARYTIASATTSGAPDPRRRVLRREGLPKFLPLRAVDARERGVDDVRAEQLQRMPRAPYSTAIDRVSAIGPAFAAL
jgi:hypothetical protein